MPRIRTLSRRVLLRGAAGIRLPVAGVLPLIGGGGGGTPGSAPGLTMSDGATYAASASGWDQKLTAGTGYATVPLTAATDRTYRFWHEPAANTGGNSYGNVPFSARVGGSNAEREETYCYDGSQAWWFLTGAETAKFALPTGTRAYVELVLRTAGGGTYEVRVNGATKASGSYPVASWTVNPVINLAAGGVPTTGNPAFFGNGALDDVSISNVARPAGTPSGPAVVDAGLIVAWPLDGNGWALGGGPATATKVALSAGTVAVGSPVTATFSPADGPWPAGETILPVMSNVAGTFSPSSLSPAAGTATPVTATFTPSASGWGFVGTMGLPTASTGRKLLGAIPAAAAYAGPATIPATLMAHGASAVQPVINTWPGFAKGHLGPNQHLVGTVGGQDFAVQQDCESYWSDGSVRQARLTFRPPATLADGALTNLSFRVAAGAPDRTALVTPAALVAAKDITLRASGYDCGSTVYVTSIRDIVTNLARDTWGTDPLGGWDVPVSGPVEVIVRAWRYRRDQATGAHHKWVRDTVYLSYRADGAYEACARSEQPNWDGPAVGATLGGTTQTKVACAVELFDGATRVRAWGGPNDPRACAVAAGAFNGTTNVVALPMADLSLGQAVVFQAGSGTLPSGIAAGQTYWPRPASGGYTLHAQRIDALGCDFIQAGANPVPFGSAGSGTVQAAPLVATFYSSGAVFAGTDGLPIRLGGQVRPDVTIGWDETYMSRRARLWPAYDQSMTRYPSAQMVGAAAYPAVASHPNQMPWTNWLNATGDNPGDDRIGIVHHTSALWLLSPHDTGFAQCARQRAIGWADQPIWLRDRHSGRIVVGDNGPDGAGGTYPNMGASRPNALIVVPRDGYLGALGGSASLADWSGYLSGYSPTLDGALEMEASHMPTPWAVPAFMTGCLLYGDMAAAQSAACLLALERHAAVGSSTYYNVIGYQQQPRGAGWALNCLRFAEGFMSAAAPEAAYIKHAWDSTAAWALALTASVPAGLDIGVVGYCALREQNQYLHTFHANIAAACLAMEARRGERPGIRALLAAQGNFVLGIANDGSAAGGSGYFANDGYGTVLTDGAGALRFTSIRAIIAGTTQYGYASPPYPATGFRTTDFATNGGFPFQATGSVVLTRAALTLMKDAGATSLNGDDPGAVLDLLNARLVAAPNTGIAFSGTAGSGISSSGPQTYPPWAIVPAGAA